MLFVDDDEPELRERDILAEQRVRADDDVCKSHLQLAENRLAFGCGGGAYEQAHVEPRGVEKRLERLVMLPREDIRRHHQGALFAHPGPGGARAAYGHHR